ncbi:MAG: hypothetical protein EOR11_19910 [Mesorhizobium sp.]|uniref:hypothetical protein n=1 Tax=Mesorhizobium sp. TaxID=1871066 RepID=UPI000FE8C343|nr:hypothetical protein [Mesorhizobium sp.]RWP84728.1 MAG: hypothetical protein EOR11_19910 [Mesorhizobium sp.]
MAEASSSDKAPTTKQQKPSISRAMLEEIILASAKLDYLKEDLRGIRNLHADHEARMRTLEAAESKRQGGSGMAAFLYGAVWPAATVTISAIALYLSHQP